jgi:hypothetical protein
MSAQDSLGPQFRTLPEMVNSGDDTGYGAGWESHELTEPHTFTRRSVPVSHLTHEIHEWQENNDQADGRYEGLHEAVSRGHVPPITVTTHHGDYLTLDGHHRVKAAHEHGVSHLDAWVHDGTLKPVG